MTNLSAFYPFVMPEVIGASDIIVDQSILRAAREFCQDSLSVRANVPLIDVVARTTGYTLVPEEGAGDVEIAEIIRVQYEGRKIDPIAPDTLAFDRANRGGGVSGYNREGTNVIRLIGAPQENSAGALKVRVAVQPRMSATSVADELFVDWAEQIAAGAKAILMALPAREYSDIKTAAMHRMTFIMAIRSAQIQANKGNARSQLRVRIPRGGL